MTIVKISLSEEEPEASGPLTEEELADIQEIARAMLSPPENPFIGRIVHGSVRVPVRNLLRLVDEVRLLRGLK